MIKSSIDTSSLLVALIFCETKSTGLACVVQIKLKVENGVIVQFAFFILDIQ